MRGLRDDVGDGGAAGRGAEGAGAASASPSDDVCTCRACGQPLRSAYLPALHARVRRRSWLLLQMIAAAGERGVHRDAVGAALWPGKEWGKGNLSVELHRLRCDLAELAPGHQVIYRKANGRTYLVRPA